MTNMNSDRVTLWEIDCRLAGEKIVIKFLCFWLSTFLLTPCIAQVQEDEFQIGVRGGLNASAFYDGNLSDQNLRYGFHLGLFTDLALAKSISLQPEIVLSTKGNRITYGDDGGVLSFLKIEGKVKTNLTYIDVPLLAKITLWKVYNIHLGPYASYLVDGKISVDGTFSNQLSRRNFKSWDYGMAIGAGTDLGRVSIGTRCHLGMTNIVKSNDVRRLLGNSKNAAWQAYVALKFER